MLNKGSSFARYHIGSDMIEIMLHKTPKMVLKNPG